MRQSMIYRSDFKGAERMYQRALAADPDAEQAGMTTHFRNVLNVSRNVHPTVVADAPDYSRIGETMTWTEPTADDVRWAIKQLRNNKAADSIGLQAELFKVCVAHDTPGETCELVRIMTETVQKLWRGDGVPSTWLDSILIPIYKRKGARGDWNGEA